MFGVCRYFQMFEVCPVNQTLLGLLITSEKETSSSHDDWLEDYIIIAYIIYFFR